MILLLQSVISTQAYYEFGAGYFKKALTLAVYVGMLLGALFWGFSSDIVGRRLAFNVTLAIASIAALIGGAVNNWVALSLMIALVGFGAGGNLILDTAVFLEYIPGKYQYLITLMALFWGLGQAVVALFALAFLGKKTTWVLFQPSGDHEQLGCAVGRVRIISLLTHSRG